MGQDVLLQIIAHLIRIPLRRVEQALHPVGRGFSRQFGELPSVFSFCGADQATDIGHGSLARLCALKVRS
jgi:hypothetical protein